MTILDNLTGFDMLALMTIGFSLVFVGILMGIEQWLKRKHERAQAAEYEPTKS